MSLFRRPFYGTSCTKIRIFRIFFILGLFFIVHLFIYEIDIKSTVALARNMLTSLTNFDRSNLSVSTTIFAVNNTTSTVTIVAIQKTDQTTQMTTMNFDLTSDLNSIKNTNDSQQPKEAFVTFSNNQPSYLAVLRVLLDSIHAFSTRPIIVFGIDVDIDIDLKQYPRVIKRRIEQKDCGPVIYIYLSILYSIDC